MFGLIGPPPRAVERELIGRRVAHLDGDVERAVVGVGAELDSVAATSKRSL